MGASFASLSRARENGDSSQHSHHCARTDVRLSTPFAGRRVNWTRKARSLKVKSHAQRHAPVAPGRTDDRPASTQVAWRRTRAAVRSGAFSSAA